MAHKGTEHYICLGEGTAIPELESFEADFFQTLPTGSGTSSEEHGERTRERGQFIYAKLFGAPRDMRDADGLDELAIDHLFADVWSRSGLSLRDRSMITVALLAAQGRDDELVTHLRGAMRQGISAIEIEEIMIHVAHYAGWPAGHHGMAVAKPKRHSK